MHALTEVTGNVYFCDFESAERGSARARAGIADAGIADIRPLVAQINAASKEIAGAHAEITRQRCEQSGDLLAMVSVIDSIALQGGNAPPELLQLRANALRELAQGARAAADEPLVLARD